MRIAQISPLWEPVPPRTYGGTELVASLLTEGLVRQGHEVVLFATADSTTTAQLETICHLGFREMGWDLAREKDRGNILATELQMLARVFSQADQFDVIHNHLGYQALPLANLVNTPVVTTLHNALWPEQVRELYAQHAHLHYISISDYQQTLWPELNYAATIYHGIDVDRYTPRFQIDKRSGYLAFLGRMCPEKGAHLAVEIAQAVGYPLILAGKIDESEREYFETKIAPHIDDQQIRYIGEVNHAQKIELLQNAIATLFPIQWAEPFGLVMIESMACGTPVLALRDGSIPEIIAPGTSGFIGESAADLIEAFADVHRIDRHDCRREAETRFAVDRMVQDHERLYRRLMSVSGASGRLPPGIPISPTAAPLGESGGSHEPPVGNPTVRNHP